MIKHRKPIKYLYLKDMDAQTLIEDCNHAGRIEFSFIGLDKTGNIFDPQKKTLFIELCNKVLHQKMERAERFIDEFSNFYQQLKVQDTTDTRYAATQCLYHFSYQLFKLCKKNNLDFSAFTTVSFYYDSDKTALRVQRWQGLYEVDEIPYVTPDQRESI